MPKTRKGGSDAVRDGTGAAEDGHVSPAELARQISQLEERLRVVEGRGDVQTGPSAPESDLQAKVTVLGEKMGSLQQRLDRLDESVESVKSKTAETERRLNATLGELVESLRREVDEKLKTAIPSSSQDDTKVALLSDHITDLSDHLADVKRDIEEITMAAEYAAAKSADFKKEVSEQIRSLEKKQSELSQQMEHALEDLGPRASRATFQSREVSMLSAQLSELEKEVESSHRENVKKFKLLTEKMEVRQEVEAKLKTSAASAQAQAQLQADIESVADELGDLKQIVKKDSASLAANIKHTSKLLLDLSDLKANEDMKSKRWAEKSDLRALAEKADLLPLASEVKELKRSVEALEKKVSKTDCTTVEQKRTDYKVGNSSVPETRGGGGGRGGLGDAFAATRPEIVAESAGAHELQNDLPMGAEASVVMAKRSSFSRNTPGKQLSSTLADKELKEAATKQGADDVDTADTAESAEVQDRRSAAKRNSSSLLDGLKAWQSSETVSRGIKEASDTLNEGMKEASETLSESLNKSIEFVSSPMKQAATQESPDDNTENTEGADKGNEETGGGEEQKSGSTEQRLVVDRRNPKSDTIANDLKKWQSSEKLSQGIQEASATIDKTIGFFTSPIVGFWNDLTTDSKGKDSIRTASGSKAGSVHPGRRYLGGPSRALLSAIETPDEAYGSFKSSSRVSSKAPSNADDVARDGGDFGLTTPRSARGGPVTRFSRRKSVGDGAGLKSSSKSASKLVSPDMGKPFSPMAKGRHYLKSDD
eukprot:Tamp_06786.p1 GENE.Tamp_06786~~Tamp_06786.p1  ORF type:complete len:790 (-),score=169.35 Tamp_06786:263-2566(-)